MAAALEDYEVPSLLWFMEKIWMATLPEANLDVGKSLFSVGKSSING